MCICMYVHIYIHSVSYTYTLVTLVYCGSQPSLAPLTLLLGNAKGLQNGRRSHLVRPKRVSLEPSDGTVAAKGGRRGMAV